MKTKDDIETAGGTCEKVATDFWECTDKDKNVWWCNHEGCVPKPRRVEQTGNVVHVPVEIFVVLDKSGGYHVAVLPGSTRRG